MIKVITNNNVMITYLPDSRWWLQWNGERRFVSWHNNNIFLTPVHNWIHDCTKEWTRKCDQSLITSTVWPNCHQGIIFMLNVVTVGRFSAPDSRQRVTWKPNLWILKSLLPYFPFPRIWGLRVWLSTVFK